MTSTAPVSLSSPRSSIEWRRSRTLIPLYRVVRPESGNLVSGRPWLDRLTEPLPRAARIARRGVRIVGRGHPGGRRNRVASAGVVRPAHPDAQRARRQHQARRRAVDREVLRPVGQLRKATRVEPDLGPRAGQGADRDLDRLRGREGQRRLGRRRRGAPDADAVDPVDADEAAGGLADERAGVAREVTRRDRRRRRRIDRGRSEGVGGGHPACERCAEVRTHRGVSRAVGPGDRRTVTKPGERELAGDSRDGALERLADGRHAVDHGARAGRVQALAAERDLGDRGRAVGDQEDRRLLLTHRGRREGDLEGAALARHHDRERAAVARHGEGLRRPGHDQELLDLSRKVARVRERELLGRRGRADLHRAERLVTVATPSPPGRSASWR